MNRQYEMGDEALSAWLDDELEATAVAEVEAALARQPELQLRLASMLRNERRLQRHFNQMVQRPVAAGLQALLRGGDAPAARGHAAPSLRLDGLRATLRSILGAMTQRPLAAAAALGIALGLGLIIGQQADDIGRPGSLQQPLALGNVDPGQPLHGLLQTARSGVPLQLTADASAVVDLTFRDDEGRFCRQFRVYDTAREQGAIAVACHHGEPWRIEIAQAGSPPIGSADRYQAAGGPDSGPIDRYVLQHNTGNLVLGAEEQDLIDGGWPVTPQANRPAPLR